MLSMLDNEVTRQSLMIGYIDDFKLMMLITLTVIPLVFFLRKPARPAAPMAQAAAAAD
jgi:DHA2 family multidrug resistance protein